MLQQFSKLLLWVCVVGVAFLELSSLGESRHSRRTRTRSTSSDETSPSVTDDSAPSVTPPTELPDGLLISEYVTRLDAALANITASILNAVSECFGQGCNDSMIAECATCLANNIGRPPLIPSMTVTEAPTMA